MCGEEVYLANMEDVHGCGVGDLSWAAATERLYRALEPEITRHTMIKACRALQIKWQSDDDTVNIDNMALYLLVTRDQAARIIEHYNSQTLCTKFKISNPQ